MVHSKQLYPSLLGFVCLATLSVPTLGQNLTRLEMGAYGAFTKYDAASLGFASHFGAGGRIGYALTRTFSVEASGDFTRTTLTPASNLPVNVTRIAGTVFAQRRLIGSNAVYLGTGYERLFSRSGDIFNDNGIHVTLGDRLPIGGRVLLRIEGRGTYFPDSPRKAAGDQVLNLSVSAGISILAFGGPPPDTDRDGINNDEDDCPNTLFGATVDPTGCPIDTDQDAIFDGLDLCPDTPAGARVDGSGCPIDDDSDGIYNGIDICPDTPTDAIADDTGCPYDTDSDRVFDGIDVCPDTPAGATVDETGCPSDEDGDRIFDGVDQCPGTPAGTAVDETGCPADQDLDGVLNAVDQCPNTPPGTAVDSNGCPPAGDADRDGVNDNLDRCPNTAPGRDVDSVGCPILFVVEQGAVQPLILRGVNFASGSSRLTEDSYLTLNDVAASLLGQPDVRIEIAGHTDNTGSLTTNTRLSLARAEAVRTYLAQRGVPVERMVARGYGPDEPIATNQTAQGRAQNRRVELRQIGR
jgi:outer membrane protein OmpA-like peptidoglycan-associated protein